MEVDVTNFVWVVDEPGGAFRRAEFPIPVLLANQVLVRIHASGVNPLDTKIRLGEAAHAQHPLPAVLALDMAGIVEEVGSGVASFEVGDEVYGNRRKNQPPAQAAHRLSRMARMRVPRGCCAQSTVEDCARVTECASICYCFHTVPDSKH